MHHESSQDDSSDHNAHSEGPLPGEFEGGDKRTPVWCWQDSPALDRIRQHFAQPQFTGGMVTNAIAVYSTLTFLRSKFWRPRRFTYRQTDAAALAGVGHDTWRLVIDELVEIGLIDRQQNYTTVNGTTVRDTIAYDLLDADDGKRGWHRSRSPKVVDSIWAQQFLSNLYVLRGRFKGAGPRATALAIYVACTEQAADQDGYVFTMRKADLATLAGCSKRTLDGYLTEFAKVDYDGPLLNVSDDYDSRGKYTFRVHPVRERLAIARGQHLRTAA